MPTLKKYNLQGEETGTLEAEEKLSEAEVNSQLVKDYIVALRANARQWSASTKTRAEVKHTTKKPHAQKGTGRARQGTRVAPHHKGGGRAFGPRPKFDQHIRLNKKERRAVIRSLIGEKIRNDKVRILENTGMSDPKTKTVAKFFEKTGVSGRVLVLGEGLYAENPNREGATISAPTNQHHTFIKSLRNLPKVEFSLAKNVSGYDVLVAHELVLTEAAYNEVVEWLS